MPIFRAYSQLFVGMSTFRSVFVQQKLNKIVTMLHILFLRYARKARLNLHLKAM